MKKGKYIDYNIIMACLGKAPGTTHQQFATDHGVADSSLLLPALREKLGFHGRFLSLASRFAALPAVAHPEAA